jgi:NADH-quinone oxidoreductase subunit L
VLTSLGACFHVFTHAFFKALLFLACGAVMHGFAGQLDLRRISGLRRMPGWRIVSWTMFYGCLCLVGFPFISSGFYSKDMIMAEAFVAHDGHIPYGFFWLGIIAVFTALLTAYYTFRVWFRVCAGPVQYEMGDDHHGDDDHHDDHHEHTPHAPRWAINLALIVITLFAAIAILPKYTGWAEHMVGDSTAAAGLPAHHEGLSFAADPHKWMPIVASITTLLGIAIAWFFHLHKRSAAEALKAKLLAGSATRWLPAAMENKWYVDELYDALIRKPLWLLGHLLTMLDNWLLDRGIIDGIASVPRAFGRMFQPLHNGVLQSYAISMAGGVGLVILLVIYMPKLIAFLGGGG